MAFFNNNWQWICGILLGLSLAGTIALGVKFHNNQQKFNKDRVDLQSQIEFLNQQLTDREEAALLAIEELDSVKRDYEENLDRLQSKLQKTQDSYKKTLAEMQPLEIPELEEYFYQKYAEEFGWSQEKFALPVNVCNRIRYDLTDRDFCIEESDLKDSVLLEQSRYIDTLNLATEKVFAERNYLSGKVQSLEQYGMDLENRNLLLEKNLKCQKVQKGVFITTTSILGILLAVTLVGNTK